MAEAISEQVESTLTTTLSELGKFDAEQRERLRQFTDQVIERAQHEQEMAMQGRSAAPTSSSGVSQSEALQVTIDELRAETARLRAELQQYRSRSV